MREVERGARVATVQDLGQHERDHHPREQHSTHPSGRTAVDGQERNRKDEVELFLDGEAPGVLERLELGRDVEIAALAPEQDVRAEERGRDQALAEPLERLWREHQPRERQAREQYDEE